MKAVEYDKLPAKFKKFRDGIDSLAAEGYWLQKKYDGCFGMAVFHPSGSSEMLSRTGENYSASCKHILHDLETVLAGEAVVVLGEVWHPDAGFPAISGLFRQQKRIASELVFVVNDMIPLDMLSAVPYRERFSALRDTVLSVDLPSIRVAETKFSREWSFPPSTYALAWKGAGGFDGAILRNPEAGYTPGLVKNGEIIKVKPVISLDLKIDAIYSTPGEKTGRPVHTVDVSYRGVTTRVGSGVPHNRDDFSIYDVVEIECMGITDDGKLREPRFKGVRIDKTVADK